MKIRELKDFNFFALEEMLLLLPSVVALALPTTLLRQLVITYVLCAPSLVVLGISKRTWSSFAFPKAHFLSAVALWGGLLLFRTTSTVVISLPVILYAFFLAIHPIFRGMPTAIGSSDRSTGAWIRLSALFTGIASWNMLSSFPYEFKLWSIAVAALALSVSILMGKKNIYYISGKATFGREFGSMGNPMAASSLLTLAFPVFADLTLVGVSTGKYWYVLILPLYLYGLFSSAGRGALMGLLLSSPFVIYMVYTYNPWYLLVVLALFLLTIWFARDYVRQLYQRTIWTIKKGITKEPRFFLWRDALRYYFKSLIGTGYDAFRRAFMAYRSKESYLAEPTVHYDKVHNIFLEELVEGSLVAFLLFISVLVQFFLHGPLVVKGMLFAAIGDGLFTIYDPANWMYFWLFGSLVSFSHAISVYWLYPIWGIVLYAFVLTALNYMPQIVAGNAEAARRRGERDIAAQMFNAAYTVFPWGIDYLAEWSLLQMSLLNEAKLTDEMAVGYHNTFKNLEPYLERYSPNIDDFYASWLMFCGKYPSLRSEGNRIFDLLQRINPYGLRIRKACAHFLGNVGNWDLAMSLLEENINEYPFDADSYYMLVLACYQQKLWSTGRKYLNQWKEKFPNDSRLPQLEQALGI
jgi:tetratricopeptide (TPR) repeat protein